VRLPSFLRETMVEPRLRRWLFFAAFILPALAVYALFFLNPFAQGIRISLTNWDGRTPRAPISMPQKEFESQILSRLGREADRRLLLEVYHLDPEDSSYKRYELTGARRNRIYRILDRAGYRPETYRYVGLDNFRAIFTGRVEERFYPRSFVKTNFNENSDLPDSIPRREFERNFLRNLSSARERELAARFYVPGEASYRLRPEFTEFGLEDRIWLLPEVEQERTVPSAAVDELIAAVKKAGLEQDRESLQRALGSFLGKQPLSPGSAAETTAAAQALFELGTIKSLLASRWKERRFDLGVTGFTLFFTFFNVLFSNLLAFALALALDTRMRSRNVLRTIFFLPNVLSMIVVALVWSFVFYNLLPAVTGIKLWMGDPAKAPWLIVMVQVWQQSGYLMVIYLAGLQNIPVDVHEAALIDGASFGRKLRHIVIPLLVPALTICLFLSLSNSLKSFDLVYAMVGPSGYATGTVPLVMDIFFDAFAKRLAGLATAKAMLLFLAIFLVTGVQLALMKRREVKL
jgi:raffinose/stachyose/melibiose transport system permease protein